METINMKLKIKNMKTSLIVLSIFLFSNLVTAQERYPVTVGQVLMDGYDPVSYFDGKPQKGKENITTKVDGRVIRFATVANKERFLKGGNKYTIAYGSWCSISMVNGDYVVPDYTLFKIQDKDLLFFSVKAFFNGLTAWERDPIYNKVLADLAFNKQFGLK
jgi:hypothetical protein